MNGIEKITDKIAEDVQREIDALNNEVKSRVDEVNARYEELARRESEEILARGRKNAAERVERLGSVAQLEARKLELAAKQEMLERAFRRAQDDLLNLPDEEYAKILSNLAAAASVTGQETVIFSQKDRDRIGKHVVDRANEILSKAGLDKTSGDSTEFRAAAVGMLTLSDETRPINGGLILSDKEAEANCTFEMLMRLRRGELEREVAAVLFD